MGLLKYSDNQQTPTKKPKNLNYIKRLVVHNIYTLYIRIEYERKFMSNVVNYKYISHLSVAYKFYITSKVVSKWPNCRQAKETEEGDGWKLTNSIQSVYYNKSANKSD